MVNRPTPRTARYFQRVLGDGSRLELCVVGWEADPRQRVLSHNDMGQADEWERYEENELLVFTSPEGWAGGGFWWLYDPRKMRTEPVPRPEAEVLALGGRTTVVLVAE